MNRRMKISITIDIPQLEGILRDTRNSLDLSQNDLAHRIRSAGMKITSQNIQRIEAGETKTLPYETLQKICEGLNLDLSQQLQAACQSQLPFLDKNENQ